MRHPIPARTEKRSRSQSSLSSLPHLPGVLRSESMADQNANADPKIDRCVRELKSKIPAAEHAALDSRLQGLINDPDTDDDDVIAILRQEFDPEVV
jgi:hypothetical protein